LVYSKNPAMPGDTVEVKAYFNEIVPTSPSFVTSWPGLGAGGPFSMDSTLNGEMLVWLTEVEVPGISVSGKVDVTPTALDRATNSIDSLGGMETELYDTTWYIDVDAPTCSLTYVNVNQPTLTNLGKGGDEVQITARFNEQAKGFSDAVPRLTIIFTDTSDHSIEETPFTASSDGDTTWTYSFDLPSDSSHTGFMTVRLAAYDLAGNLVEDVVDTNVFEIDNIPPSLFTTGTVTPMGTLPKAGWFNQRTDSVAVLVPIDSEDPSLFQGKLQIRMQIDGVPASEIDVGMPVTLTNISQDNTVDLMRDTVSTAFDPADFVEGVSLISWAELYDLAGNVTEGSSSTDTLVVDTIPPVMGLWAGGIVVDADTVISSDSLSAIWTGFTENIPAGESGINYYDWAVGRFGSTDMDSIMTWTTVTDTSADTLLPLRHLEIYNISLRAVDNAGNRSDTLETDAPGILRLNSAPELAAVDSQFVDEDVQFTYQIIGTDIDTTTLFGDTLHYTLIDTAGILIPDTSFPLIIGEYSGLIDWNTPLQADTGTYSFNVRVADEWGLSDTTGIVLTVGSVNDTPQVSLIPNVAFVEDIINGDTLSLHQYVTDVDNDTTEIIWVAVVMPDSTDYPNYPDPEFFFGPGSTPELERIIRNWVLKERVKKEFTLFGKNGTFSQPAGDTTLAVIIDTLNNSTFAYFVADSNYYVDSREVIFVATDPDGAADSTNIEVTITALNDPPVMAVMLDTSMNENDTLILPLSAIDIDDSTVTFQVLSDTSAMTVSLNDTFATFIPDQFWWVDSTNIIVIVSDEEYSDSTQFNLRVWRVPRPKLALALGQNATFTHYFEFIVTDTAEKALDISLTIQQTGEQVALDTVGDFTWVGHHSFDTTKTYDFVMYGDAKVGDTTITRSAELALARANAGWIASSSDGKFQIISGAGAVAYDQPFMIVDSLLFPVYHNSGGLYRIGHPLLSFDEPVMITLHGDTTFAEEDQALYIRDEDDMWRELPTISKDGILMSWTSEMGYFKIGRKTIFIPEHTSIQQNYPNPFNAQTHIIFDIGFFGGPDQRMNFIIYNLLGQEVYRIAKGNVEIGRHEFIWNGTDNFGVPVSSGIYITRLTTNSGFSASMKMMLMK
ncbi:MAG: FlgD immunoglobulin-like domain containing protein, partial [Candidatus Marinimicrobia bacterium]|nr:FlgD immunoglobulin-like domain containing protein [Candidatus Neomarinimicrobiota bacterium]